jgi:hypothetical protein
MDNRVVRRSRAPFTRLPVPGPGLVELCASGEGRPALRLTSLWSSNINFADPVRLQRLCLTFVVNLSSFNFLCTAAHEFVATNYSSASSLAVWRSASY